MGKRISFGLNADNYYDRGVEEADEGKYIEAISDLYLALELDPGNIYIMSEMAYAYYDLGLVKQAIKVYYRILDADKYSDIAYIGLMQSFVHENRLVSALYYLNLGIENGVLDTDYDPAEDFSIADIEEKQPAFRVLRGTNHESAVNLAKRMTLTGEYDLAGKILDVVPENSEQYVDARNHIALLSLAKGDFATSEANARAIIEKDPGNACAYCTLVMACRAGGKTEEAKEALRMLDALDVKDRESVARVAACAMEEGDDEMTVKYYGRLFDFTPYECEPTLIYAEALFNIGRKEDARSYVTALRRLYPDDGTVTYYARLINDPKTEHITLNYDIPQQEIDRRINYIEDKFSELADVEKVVDAMYYDEELYDTVIWLLFSNEYVIAKHVGSFLCQSELWQPFILDRLIDPDVLPATKKEYLLSYLRYSHVKRFSLLVGDVMLFFTPRKPKCDDNFALQDAYWEAFATCAFVSPAFQPKLNKIYKKVVDVMNNPDFVPIKIDVIVLAAVMTRLSGAHPVFYGKEHCCEIYNIKTEDYDKYIAMLGLADDDRRADKRERAEKAKDASPEDKKTTKTKENKQ